MSWYSALIEEDAMWWGIDPPREWRFNLKPTPPLDRERGMNMGALMDCMVEGREYSMWRGT